jgi:endonuclease III-like uncharacterized protein
LRLYDRLHRRYGLPAILTQGRAAVNVQRAVRTLARRQAVSPRRLLGWPAGELRAALLAMPGIGAGTADAILLHGAGRPVFVVDAATRRVLARHGIAAGAAAEEVKSLLMANLPHDPALFRQYHVLLARVAREHCRARPRCEGCPLRFDLRGRTPQSEEASAPRHLSFARRFRRRS